MSGEKPREIAAQALSRRQGDEFIEDLLERSLAPVRLSPADRRLCQELVYGCVRWQATLDWLIARKTANRTQKGFLQNLLRLGLYQIFWLERIPNHAAVNETVELAKTHGFGPQAGFVNALLRGYLREFEVTKKVLVEKKTAEPALGYSHPAWLVDRWIERWGLDRTSRLLDWNNRTPITYARINTLKADPSRILDQWRAESVDYDFVRRDWLEENLVFELRSHPPLASLPSFQQGWFYIQDPSTLLAIRELDPQPGETILDLCAAPGGKLTYAAQRMSNKGNLVAQDSSRERTELIAQNCARLGVTCVELRAPPKPQGAASSSHKLQPASFDKVLVDALCSNTGVMARRVDLRWRIRAKELERLQAVQVGLLQQAADALQPGGVLVYSTCSLEPEENSEVVTECLRRNQGFTLTKERELLPFEAKVDGAYVARLAKA